MKNIKQLVFTLAVVLLTSPVGLAGAASIQNTGYKSTNIISIGSPSWQSSNKKVKNSNTVNLGVNTTQNASTGNATVKNNTKGGNATSGDASNTNGVGVMLSFVNSTNSGNNGCCGGGGLADASIKNTGPNSFNLIQYGSGGSCGGCNNSCNNQCENSCGGCGGGSVVKNENNVDVDVDTKQNATTGNASVVGNTTGGNATSGDAENDNEVVVEIEAKNATNTGSSCGNLCGGGNVNASINTTGPNSTNVIEVGGNPCCFGDNVHNTNDVVVDVDTDQNASSGNAEVSHNTTGGNATSGDATNTSSSEVSVSAHNG